MNTIISKWLRKNVNGAPVGGSIKALNLSNRKGIFWNCFTRDCFLQWSRTNTKIQGMPEERQQYH